MAKLMGAVSLLRDEAYQWWLTVREGIPADRVTWELFKTAFKGKYVGTSYVDARKKEFLNLVQEGKTVAEYEAEFLRVLIAPQREQDFAVLVEKVRIAEEVKRAEKQNREKDRNHFRRDSGPSGGANRIIKRARAKEPVRAVPMNMVRPSIYGDCGKVYLGDCRKRSGACFQCGSMEHRVRDCPQKVDQVQAAEQRIAQPVRGRPQPLRGRGQGRGGNGSG
ncbi:uncharacterized protein [Gossypium hirsutum]|uniref:CCHC-type domain-containing protein n=1 Tax=Gossypium hirsutum TaxID=3635 RepID=A0ABM2ZDH2_GOSHI|nr:uncharacterized protein LOC121212301 [Gossypium hirsutum]